MHEGNPEQYERLNDLSNQQRINLSMYDIITEESGARVIAYTRSTADKGIEQPHTSSSYQE